MKKETVLLLFFLCGAFGLSADADTFETRQGKVHEGTILDEDAGYLYIDTAAGVINIRKADIADVNGEPYHYMGQGTAPVKAAPSPEKQAPAANRPQAAQAPAWPKNLGRPAPSDADPAPGQNYPVYFTNSMTNEEAAAVSAQTLKAQSAHMVIHPSGVTEQDLEVYYNAHREEFRMPAQVRFKFLNPLTLKGDPGAAARNPASAQGWQDTGWKKKGENFNAPFSAGTLERIFNLKKGEALHVEDGGSYVFWASDRKESYIMPFSEARPKILTKILQKR